MKSTGPQAKLTVYLWVGSPLFTPRRSPLFAAQRRRKLKPRRSGRSPLNWGCNEIARYVGIAAPGGRVRRKNAMDILEKLRLADTELTQQAVTEIEELRLRKEQMREVCRQLAEQLYITNSASDCGEDAAIARATRH